MQRNVTGSCFEYSELFVTHQRKDIEDTVGSMSICSMGEKSRQKIGI